MPDVVLIYPYYRSRSDRSIFRFPPLGLGYLASYLRTNDISVKIVDGTFRSEEGVVHRVRRLAPTVIGIYSMFTLEENARRLARRLRRDCDFLVAGGPLPSLYAERFLTEFDIVVIGEGEVAMLETVKSLRGEAELSQVAGIVYRIPLKSSRQDSSYSTIQSEIRHGPPRKPFTDLDALPFPARDLFDNDAYKRYHEARYGCAATSMISTRGCPFSCDFCSKPVFGDSYRERSAQNVVDEMEHVLSFGYRRVFFQDDCFTLNEERVKAICDEILSRQIEVDWECLSRVDHISEATLVRMKEAGCRRVFFGIESGSDAVLKVMKKQVIVEQARKAVESAASTGIRTGAFFILGYPGETEETVLDTIRFATSLPLDYLSFTLPYPIPGTGLYEKVKDVLKGKEGYSWNFFIDHTLQFKSTLSERKLKFAIVKAMLQFRTRKYLGNRLYAWLGKPFERLTDRLFTMRTHRKS